MRLQWFLESPMAEDPELQCGFILCVLALLVEVVLAAKYVFFVWTVEFPNTFIVISTT